MKNSYFRAKSNKKKQLCIRRKITKITTVLNMTDSLFPFLLPSGDAQKTHVSCERRFRKIGCFTQQSSQSYDLLINDRDPTSHAFQGYVLDWKNIEASFHR